MKLIHLPIMRKIKLVFVKQDMREFYVMNVQVIMENSLIQFVVHAQDHFIISI